MTAVEPVECIHGLPPYSCTICLHPDRGPEQVTVEGTWRAVYGGHCNECNLPISVGQTISRLSTERIVHQWCAP